jgi:hypothetical protein
MSQNDFNLANQGFPSMRADINSAFQALATNSSGATAPPTTYAHQWWYDTGSDTLKIRNEGNDAWIDLAAFDQTTDSWSFTSVDINGGTIDGSVIGGTTPAAGNFTTTTTDNISDGTDTVETGYVVNGSAKSWVNLKGTGTIAVQDSLNVASVTDNNTGDYTVNFSSSMVNSNFAATASTWQSVNVAGVGQNVLDPTTSSQQVRCHENNVGTDPNALLMSIQGELA